ncbi:MAG: antitoxin MazE-like protein [Gemmatimonadota bacterium]
MDGYECRADLPPHRTGEALLSHDILHVMRKPPSKRHVQQYRLRMRRAGLRLVQFWGPGTRIPGFAEECRRQSRRAARARRGEREALDLAGARVGY